MINDIIAEPEVGKIYDGTITKMMAFGAFCEYMKGREGSDSTCSKVPPEATFTKTFMMKSEN